MTFGERLKLIRIREGLHQAQLAELAQVRRADIIGFEAGRINPADDEIARLKAALYWDAETDRGLEMLAKREGETA